MFIPYMRYIVFPNLCVSRYFIQFTDYIVEVIFWWKLNIRYYSALIKTGNTFGKLEKTKSAGTTSFVIQNTCMFLFP